MKQLFKKGGTFTIETIVYLILIIMTFAILASVVVQIGKGSDTVQRDQTCRTSALLNAQTKTAGLEVFFLDCPQRLVRVTSRDIDPKRVGTEVETIKKKYQQDGVSYTYNIDKGSTERELRWPRR